MLNQIPQELRALSQWVCAGADKVPFNPRTGQLASPTDPATWGTFDEARRAGMKHVGFVLAPWDPYTIIDLDNKPEKPCTPEQWTRHQKILEAFDSYTERSASGSGYHIIVRGRIPAGVHRDNVEVYSESRYMICTGDVVRPSPIADFQPLLDILFAEMQPVAKTELVQIDGPLADEEVIEMAMRAANADKFNQLCAGDWQNDYPSQSEADFALLSIFAFYTRDNEQVRRLFRMSALGKREKAVKNDRYLNFALEKIRAQQPGPVDLEALKVYAEVIAAQGPSSENEEATAAPLSSISLPPGLVGEMAQYFYQTAIRPVPEIALTAALGLAAGVCARSYNISGSGLNQYIILLAKTGSGKEGAMQGIENLTSFVRPQIPMVDQFIGPATFASGQALVKVLADKPCFVSVLGEFGLTLQQLSDSKANSAQLMLRKMLLDLYAKSGWNRTLRSSVYADTEKNTKIVQAPNVSIFGESTPETFFDGLDSSHIAEGLIPRFSVVEYTGPRPPRNRNANVPPSAGLAQRFCDLVTVALTTSNNNTCCPVHLDNHSLVILDDFDAHADAMINGARQDVEMQLWNRAHLKALKLSALLAVGCNPHQPVVTQELAQWAIDFVSRDVALVTKRFTEGDVGQGDSKQYHDLKRAILQYVSGDQNVVKSYNLPRDLFDAKVIPYKYLARRTAAMASFKSDRTGATAALKRSIQTLVDSGAIKEVSKAQLEQNFKFCGVAYCLVSNTI